MIGSWSGGDGHAGSPQHGSLAPRFWSDFEIPTTMERWKDDTGQDIAEYAVMLAVILVLVVGTIRLVGSNANNAFSSVASSIQ